MIMKYEKICRGKFIERPNRFTAYVDICGSKQKVHVKNTGRCRELLVPGAEVYLEDFSEKIGKRRLRYSVVGVKKETEHGSIIINMDSQAPNKVVKEALEAEKLVLPGLADISFVRGEYRYGDSRLDFMVKDSSGKTALAEVKGVTLEMNGTARFPDAPTERGIKHIEELIKAKSEGYAACIIFVIQMNGAEYFEPNYDTHPEFGDALCRAESSGVAVLAYDCQVEPGSLKLGKPVKVRL